MFVILEGTVIVEMRGGWHTELRCGRLLRRDRAAGSRSARVSRACAPRPRSRCLERAARRRHRPDRVASPALALAMLRELARRLRAPSRTISSAQDRNRLVPIPTRHENRLKRRLRRRALRSHISASVAGDTRAPAYTCRRGRADRNEADCRQPPSAVRLRAARARRGRSGAHRLGGESGARRRSPARPGIRGHPRRRGLARGRVDRRVRAGSRARARSRSATASSCSTARRSTRCTGRCARRASLSSPRACTSRTGA